MLPGPLSRRAFAPIGRRRGTLSIVSRDFLVLKCATLCMFVPGYWVLNNMSAMFGDLVNWLERWQWSCAACMSSL